MGRFFQTSSPQFLQNTQYNPNLELMMKVIQNDNALRNAIEEQAMKTEYELLNTPHLQFDREALNAIQKGYASSIEELANSVYNDVDITQSSRPRMKALQKRLLEDKLNGDLGAITNRHSAWAKFMEENKDVKDKDPGTYNLAMAYEMNKLMNETKKNSKATFTGYKIQGTPDFRKELVAEIDKLKASSRTVPDGKGYLVKIKDLPADRIMNLAVSHIMQRPEYREFARQQTMYGAGGFYDQDGKSIAPFTFISPDGRTVSPEELAGLSEQEIAGLRRVANPNWRFGNEINQLAQAFAHREQDMSSDSTYTAMAGIEAANARHAQSMALEREKLNWQKQKFALEQEAKEYGGSDSGGSGGGKENSPGLGMILQGNPSGARLDGYQTTQSFAEDLNDIKAGNPAVLERLRGVQSKFLAAPGLRGVRIGSSKTNSIDLGRLASDLVNKGVDLTKASDPKYRATILQAISKYKDKNGAISLGDGKVNKLLNSAEAQAQVTKQLGELLEDRAAPIVTSAYSNYNTTTNVSSGYAIRNANDARRIMEDVMLNKVGFKIYDEATGQLVPQQDYNAFINNSDIQLYYHPTANSRYGGVVSAHYTKEDAMGNKRRYRAVLEGSNFENLPSTYGKQSVARDPRLRGTDTFNQMTDLADMWNAKVNAGTNYFSPRDIEVIYPGASKIISKMYRLDNNNIRIFYKDGKTSDINTQGMTGPDALVSLRNALYLQDTQNNN